jgi:hypothetical protein
MRFTWVHLTALADDSLALVARAVRRGPEVRPATEG